MIKVKNFVKHIFGDEYKQEFRALLSLAFPVIITSFFKCFNFTISIIMCGHLSRVELDSVAISNTALNILGLFIFFGLSTAMDTIFSRTFGRGDKHKMLMLLMRFWLLSGCTFLIIASMFIQSESILLLLQQNALIAKLSSSYIAYYLPGLFFDFSFLTFARYLQNQNIVFPSMILSLCGNILNAVGQYIAIYVLNYGYLSSAICQAATSCLLFFTQLFYILYSKIYKESDFNYKDILINWGFFFKLGIPGIFMIALQDWCFEIASIASGIIGVVPLAVNSILFQINTIAYMIPLGISIAVTIRVGQHLGAGSPEKARNCFRLSLALVFCTATVVCILILSLTNILPRAFTNDQEVIDQTSSLIGILGYFQYVDGFASIPGGVIRGCGRQLLGAISNFICYYIISVPIGFVLAFVVKLEVKGLWIGLAIGVTISATVLLIIVCKTNFNKYTEISSKCTEIPVEVKECSESESESWLKTEETKDEEEKVIKEFVLDDQTPEISISRLVSLRLLTIVIVLIIFSVSLIMRLVRGDNCVPLSSLDNSTDISRFSFVSWCNQTEGNTE